MLFTTALLKSEHEAYESHVTIIIASKVHSWIKMFPSQNTFRTDVTFDKIGPRIQSNLVAIMKKTQIGQNCAIKIIHSMIGLKWFQGLYPLLITIAFLWPLSPCVLFATQRQQSGDRNRLLWTRLYQYSQIVDVFWAQRSLDLVAGILLEVKLQLLRSCSLITQMVSSCRRDPLTAYNICLGFEFASYCVRCQRHTALQKGDCINVVSFVIISFSNLNTKCLITQRECCVTKNVSSCIK